MLGNAVVPFAINLGEQLVLPISRTVRQQRAVRRGRSQGAFQVRSWSRVDGTIRLDVVALGDHGGGVSEESSGCVGPDAAAITVAPVRRYQRRLIPLSARPARTRNSRKVRLTLYGLSGPPLRLAKMVRVNGRSRAWR